ncbi:Cytochrome P450 18a1 [Eumeta japonica]|uniref:Cytochrome P450 18a1 n=1 Tax=Eumeta variegata TaxID=151549 RepID=A0A4C2A4X6_EUMVA|nr:Cytochrome P450 18a1 [Eumeta japonica]
MFANSKLLWAGWQLVSYCASRTSLPLLAGLCVLLLVTQLAALLRGLRKLPPGPWGPPVVGYLPFLGVRHKTFLELARSYGRAVLSSARQPAYRGAQRLPAYSGGFSCEEFTGRPSTPLMHLDGLGELY